MCQKLRRCHAEKVAMVKSNALATRKRDRKNPAPETDAPAIKNLHPTFRWDLFLNFFRRPCSGSISSRDVEADHEVREHPEICFITAKNDARPKTNVAKLTRWPRRIVDVPKIATPATQKRWPWSKVTRWPRGNEIGKIRRSKQTRLPSKIFI